MKLNNLWGKASPVPREQHDLADVLDAKHGHKQPLRAQAPARMGRHTEPERLKIELKTVRVESLLYYPAAQ